jgi:hypothetical protein
MLRLSNRHAAVVVALLVASPILGCGATSEDDEVAPPDTQPVAPELATGAETAAGESHVESFAVCYNNLIDCDTGVDLDPPRLSTTDYGHCVCKNAYCACARTCKLQLCMPY